MIEFFNHSVLRIKRVVQYVRASPGIPEELFFASPGLLFQFSEFWNTGLKILLDPADNPYIKQLCYMV